MKFCKNILGIEGEIYINFFRNIFFILSLGIIFWILWSSLYAVPAVDDYCFAYWTKINGVFNNIRFVYLEVNGRFISTLLISAFTSSRVILTEMYYLVPLAIISCVYFSIKYFLKFFGIEGFRYSVIFFVIVIASFSFRETIFWLSGGFTYALAFSLFLFISIVEFKIAFRHYYCNYLKILFIGTLTVVLAGFNETIMLAHIIFLAFLLGAAFFLANSRQNIYALIVIFFFAITGVLIAKFSPGNSIRSSSIPHNPNFFFALSNTFLVVIGYWKSWVLGVSVFSASLFILQPKMKIVNLDCKIYAGCLFFGFLASIFVREYVVGGLGPLRAQSNDHLFISLITFFIALFCNAKIKNINFRPIPRFVLLLAASTFLFGGILYKVGADGSPFILVLMDMRYAKDLHQYMRERNRKLSKSGGEVPLENFAAKSLSITFFDDIQSDPQDWRNKCLAYYYQLDKVFLIN